MEVKQPWRFWGATVRNYAPHPQRGAACLDIQVLWQKHLSLHFVFHSFILSLHLTKPLITSDYLWSVTLFIVTTERSLAEIFLLMAMAYRWWQWFTFTHSELFSFHFLLLHSLNEEEPKQSVGTSHLCWTALSARWSTSERWENCCLVEIKKQVFDRSCYSKRPN